MIIILCGCYVSELDATSCYGSQQGATEYVVPRSTLQTMLFCLSQHSRLLHTPNFSYARDTWPAVPALHDGNLLTLYRANCSFGELLLIPTWSDQQ